MISIILEVRSQIMITETKAKSEIRELDEWDAMLRAMMDEEVRRGNFEIARLKADGEPVYRLTTKVDAVVASTGLVAAATQPDSEQFRSSPRTSSSIWRQEGYMAPKPKPARFEFTVGMVLAMALTILVVRQEGYMAPKPKPARFEFTVGIVLAMALTILVVMTWAVAAP